MSENFITNLAPVINKELAGDLSRFSGDWIVLNKNVKINPDALSILSDYKGRIFTNALDLKEDGSFCEDDKSPVKEDWEDFKLQNEIRIAGSNRDISDQLKSLGFKGLIIDFYGHYEWEMDDVTVIYDGNSERTGKPSGSNLDPTLIKKIRAITFPETLPACKYSESYVIVKFNFDDDYGYIYHHYGHEFQDDNFYYNLIMNYLNEMKVKKIVMQINQLDIKEGYIAKNIESERCNSTENINFKLISHWLRRAILSPSSDPTSELELDFVPVYSVISFKIKNITRYESTNLSICLDSKSFIFSNSKGSVTVSINEPLKEAAKIYL